MNAVSPSDRDRIDGLATFAAATFLTAVGVVATLERVGAPDRLVQALGPLAAFVGLTIIGALNRTARLPEFLAAGRATPPVYGGLAFAATVGGFVLALGPTRSGAGPLPWPALALGLAAAALVVGPLLRSANASALADVLATRFAAAPTRVAFALALWTIGLALAVAGFETAADALVAAVGASRRVAEIAVALALAATVVPGGLKGLLWSDAASAGGALAIAAIGAGLAWGGFGAPPPPIAEVVSGWLVPADWLAWPPIRPTGAALFDAAVALAAATLFAFSAPALGAPRRRAARAGLFGLVFSFAGLALGAIGLAAFPPAAAAARPPTASALIGAATFLPAVALARAGVFGAARAAGVNLAAAYARLAVLASERLARIRLMMLTVIVLAGVLSDLRPVDSAQAIVFALALDLALVFPALILAAVSSGGASAAATAFAVGLAALIALGHGRTLAGASAREILIAALIAAAAGLLAGAVVGVVAPAPARSRRAGTRADPFADLPLDAVE
jgi:hypothetical protein